MTRAERTIDNLINGNLSDAKTLAKGVSFTLLEHTAREAGMSSVRATKAAVYLTCRESDRQDAFQAYCDA